MNFNYPDIEEIESDLTVLSLFDGMSCARIALKKLGIKPKKFYASEIDKFAIKEVQANWDDVIHLGDVTKWREWDIDWEDIDLVIGGSPCQGFSTAGKGEAFNDPRSRLFFDYLDIVNYLDMRKRVARKGNLEFYLENVKMKSVNLNKISNFLGVNPTFINSSLVSAQNRQRWYWGNWDIEKPEDRKIYLKDILQYEGLGVLKDHGKFRVSDKKSNCIDANYFKGIDNHAQRTAIAFSYNRKDGFIKELGKAHPLNASDWRGLNRNQNQTAVVYTAAAIRGRRLNEKGIRDNKYPLTQCLEVSDSQKSMCLTTVPSKDCLVSNEPPGQYQDIYNRNDLYYRKLTVIECCRLQTVPDDYFKVSSPSQAYKMLGNGMTVDVIADGLKQSNCIKRILQTRINYESANYYQH